VLKLKDDFSKTLKKARLESKKTTKEMRTGFKKAGDIIKKFKVAIIAVAAAMYVMVKAVKSIIVAFKAQEQAEARLTAALQNQGYYTEENIRQLKELAKARQKVTTFGDEETISAMAMLASFKLNTAQISKMTPLMQDLAVMTSKTTGSQADLESMAKLVGLALEGQAGRLKQAGISLTEEQQRMLLASNRGEKFAIIMDIISQNAKGLAVAVGDTATGGIDKLANKFSDIKENAGKAFSDFLGKAIDKLEEFGLAGERAGIPTDEFNLLRTEVFKTTEDVGQLISISDDLALAFYALRQQGFDVSSALSIATREVGRATNPLKFYGKMVSEISDKRLVKLKDQLKGVGIELKDNDAISLQVIARYSEMEKIYDDVNMALDSSVRLWNDLNGVQEEGVEEIVDITNAYSSQKEIVSGLLKQIEDHTAYIIKNGDATGELTKKKQELIIDLVKEKGKLAEINVVLDSVNESIDSATTKTKTFGDTLMESWGAAGAEVLRNGGIIEEEFRKAAEANGQSQEQIDERLRKAEEEGTTILRTKDKQAELNKEIGVNLASATEESKEAREELNTSFEGLAENGERFRDAIGEAQTKLEELNATPLESKEAEFTVTINRRIFDINQ